MIFKLELQFLLKIINEHEAVSNHNQTWVLLFVLKWTRRELNPRPKAHPFRLLPSQSFYFDSRRHKPNDRLNECASFMIPSILAKL